MYRHFKNIKFRKEKNMTKNLFLRLMSALLCICFMIPMFAGCAAKDKQPDTTAASAEDVLSLENVDPETLEQLVDGYDPESDDLSAERSASGEVSLAGTVLTINGEEVSFSNSKLVEYTKISPNKNDPYKKTTHRTHKIDTITIHCMAGQLSLELCGNVFADADAKASSNYGIDKDGRIGMYVEEKDRSWCSSNSENDNRAVTIEVASDSSEPYKVNDAAYKSLIKLVADICQRNEIKKLVWSADKYTRITHQKDANMTVHRDFANKSCPGDYLYSRMGDIAKKVNAILSQNAGTKTSTTKSEFPYMVKIKAKMTDVRKGAGTEYDIVTTVKKGEVYTIVEEQKVNSGTWGKLKNDIGWINLKDTEKVK